MAGARDICHESHADSGESRRRTSIEEEPMAPHAIISYDDTPNDHDALMLGRVLRDAGATLSFAYVRHAHQTRAAREQLAESEAEALLSRGAGWLEDTYAERHVVISAA